MLIITSEQTSNIDKELCACFIDWQKAVYCLNWAKLKQILKANGNDWGETRLSSKLYVDQVLRYEWYKGRQCVRRSDEKLDNDDVGRPFYLPY
jgi:hypothetical protein